MSWGGRRIAKLRLLVLSAYGPVCWLCRKPINLAISPRHLAGLTIDHVLPRSKGGSDALANLRPAHRRCNLARGNRRPANRTGRRRESAPVLCQEGQEDPPPASLSPRVSPKNGGMTPIQSRTSEDKSR